MQKIIPLILVFLIFAGCKKQDDLTNNKFEVQYQFQSIFPIKSIQTVIFEGWVTPTKSDINEWSKRLYSVYRSNETSFKTHLPPGPYTVFSVYDDDITYISKIDLKQNEKVGFEFNKYKHLSPSFLIDRVIVSKNELTYLRLPNKESFGADSKYISEIHYFVNNKPVIPNFGDYGDGLNFQFKEFTNGKNNVEVKIKHIDGKITNKVGNLIFVDSKTLDNVWNSVDNEYLKQDVFNTNSFLAFGTDKITNNLKIHGKTLIVGIYGHFKFAYKDNDLEQIEVVHGNLNQEPYLLNDQFKKQIEEIYGSPTKLKDQTNTEYYEFKYKTFIIRHYIGNDGTIKTLITKAFNN